MATTKGTDPQVCTCGEEMTRFDVGWECPACDATLVDKYRGRHVEDSLGHSEFVSTNDTANKWIDREGGPGWHEPKAVTA